MYTPPTASVCLRTSTAQRRAVCAAAEPKGPIRQIQRWLRDDRQCQRGEGRCLQVTRSGNGRAKWTEYRIRVELGRFLKGRTVWPPYREFQRAGLRTLRDTITRRGGARRWAQIMGVRYVDHRPGYAPIWTEERIRTRPSWLPGAANAMAVARRVRTRWPHGAAQRGQPDWWTGAVGQRVWSPSA